jgi:hypothetical protein
LARWLGTQGDNLPALHIVLSARFVRWQLLPWQPELTQAKERTAYATLRFRETFGRVAETWQVQHALQAPGKVALACAVDAALLETLRSCCAAAGIRLASVTPYFSCAFDRWRNVIQGQTAWFGLIESDNVTLGLLRDGNWIALRNQYLDGAWHNVLPGLMAQMGIPAGLGKDPEPLYLAGDCEEPTPAAGLSFVWLRPQAPMERALPGFRLALGI